MDSEWIVSLVSLGIVGLLIWGRKLDATSSGSRDESASQDGATSLTEQTSVRENQTEKTHVDAAKQAKSRVDRDLQMSEKEHHKALEEVREKVARGRRYVVDSGLNHVVPSVWRTVQHWASWVTMPDQWTAPDGITEIAGSRDEDVTWVSWKWRSQTYKMTLTQKRNYMPDDYSSLALIGLEVGGKPVVSLDCVLDPEGDYDGWRFSSVHSLSVGSWMSDFITMDGELRTHEEQKTRGFFAQIERDRAGRMDLGD